MRRWWVPWLALAAVVVIAGVALAARSGPSNAPGARAQQWKAEIGRADGLALAADIVERAIETREPVLRP